MKLIKRFITVFSFFIFLLFTINTITVIAQPVKSLKQGLYTVEEASLVTNSTYKVRNRSLSNEAIVIVFDGNQKMQEFIRLEPNSPEYFIRPLSYDYW